MKEYSRQHTLHTAQLDWTEGGDPISKTYGDLYFSKKDGLAESEYVFFELNDLPNRWKNKKSFAICELGFGTGLNFLIAVDKWQKNSGDSAWLNFISIENEPLNIEDLKRALIKWPSLIHLTNELVGKYPPPIPGYHRILFPSLRTSLTLCLGDAAEMLEQLNAKVDAWFLDGFAPANNPEMWTENIYTNIARLSNESSTFGTFTAASAVRRSLEQLGFEITTCEGFMGKRHSLKGVFKGNAPKTCHQKPWLSLGNLRIKRPRTAAVIGAGIAGTSVARALTLRGVDVTVYDKAPEAAAAASGNPLGLLHPYPMTARNELGVMLEKGFLFAKRMLTELEYRNVDRHDFGALQIPATERLKKVLSELPKLERPSSLIKVVSSEKATETAGTTISQDCFYSPSAEAINPKQFCSANLTNIDCRFNSEVASIRQQDSGWSLNDETEVYDILVIACSYHAAKFEQTKYIFMRPIRGELVKTKATSSSSNMKTILAFDGYIIPEVKGQHLIGASFERDDVDLEPRAEVQEDLISKVNDWLPELKLSTSSRLSGRVSVRASTFDKLPFLGPAPDYNFYKSNYADPHTRKTAPSAEYHPGLFLSLGYGSRGFISAQLCGEQLASQILGEPNALNSIIVSALHPGRVLLREFKNS